MQNKKNWIDCGNIHSKNAKKFDEDYVWGLKFYVLILECFKYWAMNDEVNFG